VKLYGYDRGKRDPFKFKVVEAEVIARSDGYVFYDRSPGPGSSGSCVLNEKDEVVAINVGIWQHGQEAFTPVGVEIVGGWSVK
jgi:V8-like Glu-specific endopeptidase